MSTPDEPAGRGEDVFTGVTVGIVTNNEDPEGLGRVKVTFPWRSTDDETLWAPVVAPMAGDEMGTYFLPEVDDRVLVAFERGDFRYPYVVGSLWHENHAPPTENEGDNDIRTIRSRSGHQLSFDDDESEGKVQIETAAGHTITLDDTSGSETIKIEDSSGANRIEFNPPSNELSIESDGTLSIDAMAIEISGTGNVSIEAGGVLSLDGMLIELN
ncbi:phage baseplate assembly protein V [Natrialbaceae archaeon AArc-T1-2]|uniref:phage baseplate assembly protein V n=1 Tax=Natrialbaceae archaeon AArc-T1-2 TaxID=3053904 RepID=UPI00255AFDBE|nr:phage baseplate assembly protein V [Natrialbaceae archaeon AArc-T1-2]WIV66071.1 phage baseplate assembly protein V [Natrialbaceae archaeon AArc-T1-2]